WDHARQDHHGHRGGADADHGEHAPMTAPMTYDSDLGGTAADGSVAVSLRGLRKTFGPVTAVDGVDLDIAEGEFFSMLGPSGSGKTTVLRLIAGFETPTDGRILLGS